MTQHEPILNGSLLSTKMNKPLLLDLYSGAGGCGYGYHLAGFDVVGCDIEPMPRYPFTFHRDDALVVLDTLLSGNIWHGYHLNDFAVIHASPPCQRFTHMLNHGMADRNRHPDFIKTTRQRLQATGKLYVIENVPGARKELIHPFLLCGKMFDLRVYRHRLFELSPGLFIFGHSHIKHKEKIVHAGMAPRHNEFYCPVGHLADQEGSQKAMGITWMQGQHEIAQAIPPAYTHWIGAQLLNYLNTEEGSEVVA